MRIVSLVPSLTKTICDFGLQDKLVGITNFCVDPPGVYRACRRVGGTKDPRLDEIAELDPTHIVINEEENKSEHIEALRREFNVLSTFPKSPADVPAMLRDLGVFLDCAATANDYATSIESIVNELRSTIPWRSVFGRKFVYLIWRDPWMAAGEDTYISRFLELLGLENAIKLGERYPIITQDLLSRLEVDVVFMSSEPWPFRQRDALAWQQTIGTEKSAKIFWIDGKACSWYGSLTRDSLLKFARPSELKPSSVRTFF